MNMKRLYNIVFISFLFCEIGSILQDVWGIHLSCFVNRTGTIM